MIILNSETLLKRKVMNGDAALVSEMSEKATAQLSSNIPYSELVQISLLLSSSSFTQSLL